MQEQDETQDLVEQFRRQDFYDKRFYLTSHPIEPHKPKGRLRWSIKYNKFVGKYYKWCSVVNITCY